MTTRNSRQHINIAILRTIESIRPRAASGLKDETVIRKADYSVRYRILVLWERPAAPARELPWRSGASLVSQYYVTTMNSCKNYCHTRGPPPPRPIRPGAALGFVGATV